MAKKEKKKIVSMTEKVMNIWAKISSILIIPLLILLIVLLLMLIFTEGLSEGMGELIVSIFAILFYLPLIYYAWFKKLDNKNMKVFAKIISCLTAILSIGTMLIDKDSQLFIEVLIFYTPVFYYAWRDYFN